MKIPYTYKTTHKDSHYREYPIDVTLTSEINVVRESEQRGHGHWVHDSFKVHRVGRKHWELSIYDEDDHDRKNRLVCLRGNGDKEQAEEAYKSWLEKQYG